MQIAAFYVLGTKLDGRSIPVSNPVGVVSSNIFYLNQLPYRVSFFDLQEPENSFHQEISEDKYLKLLSGEEVIIHATLKLKKIEKRKRAEPRSTILEREGNA